MKTVIDFLPLLILVFIVLYTAFKVITDKTEYDMNVEDASVQHIDEPIKEKEELPIFTKVTGDIKESETNDIN